MRARSHACRYAVALGGAITVALALCGATPVPAQTAEPFAAKTVQLIIGFGPGGHYDLWARTIARHMGRHLPGKPSVVPQNMPGAGSYVAASHIYNVAPKDGTVFAAISRDSALGPLMGATGAMFDPRSFSWLGSPARETNICFAYRTAAVKTARDLFATQLIVADTGAGTGTRVYPKALGELLGMKFKIVGGFRSSSEVFLAMERGEVDGFCESLDSVRIRHPDWIADKKIAILFQGGAEPHPDLKDVPSILDFARTPEERRAIEFLYAGQGIGRPYVAPPHLAPGRLKMLRDAFAATMTDAEFIADTKKNGLDLDPQDGERLAALIQKIYATPKPIVDRIGAMMK